VNRRFFDPSLMVRTYRDPRAWLSLGTDLVPIIAIILFHWRSTPLVALYWLENLVIGVYTILRLAGSALGGIGKLMVALFMISFFAVHYGMFCYGHGVFLHSFAVPGQGSAGEGAMALVDWALASGEGMIWFVAAIILSNAIFFAVDFIGKGEFRRTNPPAEMFAPFGRIVIRVVFGIMLSMMRRRRLDGQLGKVGDKFAPAL